MIPATLTTAWVTLLLWGAVPGVPSTSLNLTSTFQQKEALKAEHQPSCLQGQHCAHAEPLTHSQGLRHEKSHIHQKSLIHCNEIVFFTVACTAVFWSVTAVFTRHPFILTVTEQHLHSLKDFFCSLHSPRDKAGVRTGQLTQTGQRNTAYCVTSCPETKT